MNESESLPIEGLTKSGIALVLTQLFRLLFGGYLVAFDQFYYNDMESAWSVFFVYALVGILTALFLVDKKKLGLIGLMVLSVVLLIMESVYVVIYFSQPTPDPALHDPTAIWWATALNYIFPLLTLLLAISAYTEI